MVKNIKKIFNDNLTPKQIVFELNKYVIGQDKAKKAVAIALRNRWRRQQVKSDIRDEIYPHNILMIGPTGVGKTEIARRLAKMLSAPFIKVEATKFTEVGYVGRDVDSIIRDLTDIACNMLKEQSRKEVRNAADLAAKDRIVDVLVGDSASNETKSKFIDKLNEGILDDKEININVLDNNPSAQSSMFDIPGVPGGQMGMFNISDMLNKALGSSKTKNVNLKIKDAYKIILKEETDKLLDDEKIISQAITLVENNGIVFLDEIDKICTRSNEGSRTEVSREGVQRDLLPLIEGCTVTTKYGMVKTDHILFIASGAFHLAKPSDLLPELQGRLPIRVELESLSEKDLIDILSIPKHSLLKQYIALLKIEKVALNFTQDGIETIARISAEANRRVENIGARRLHTILGKILEEVNFLADELSGTEVVIDKKFVESNLAELSTTLSQDLSKFIL